MNGWESRRRRVCNEVKGEESRDNMRSFHHPLYIIHILYTSFLIPLLFSYLILILIYVSHMHPSLFYILHVAPFQNPVHYPPLICFTINNVTPSSFIHPLPVYHILLHLQSPSIIFPISRLPSIYTSPY